MTLYSFTGGDLNAAGNYETLNDDGTPVLVNGQPVHPNSVPTGGGVSIIAGTRTMHGTTSVGTFSGGLLNSGTITATVFEGQEPAPPRALRPARQRLRRRQSLAARAPMQAAQSMRTRSLRVLSAMATTATALRSRMEARSTSQPR